MGNAVTVVLPVKLGLTGLDVRLCRVPGPDLGWSEDEWPPVGGDGSDGFSIPWLGASLIHRHPSYWSSSAVQVFLLQHYSRGTVSVHVTESQICFSLYKNLRSCQDDFLRTHRASGAGPIIAPGKTVTITVPRGSVFVSRP
jgi:hypothetical protein